MSEKNTILGQFLKKYYTRTMSQKYTILWQCLKNVQYYDNGPKKKNTLLSLGLKNILYWDNVSKNTMSRSQKCTILNQGLKKKSKDKH